MNLRHRAARLGIISASFFALAIPALGSRAVAASTTGSPAALTRCYTNQVTITPTISSGGLGHLGLMFKIHNRSNVTCDLYGYPGAQLLDAHQHTLPTHVSRGFGYLSGNQRPRTVVLKPGSNGFFVLEWEQIPTGNQPCPTASYVRIIPPNDYTSRLVRLPRNFGINACGGDLTASPVEPNRFNF